MTDETEANPAAEPILAPEAQEAPQVEANEPAAEQETDDLDNLLKEALGTEEDGNPELLDVEYEGETFKVPPKLKDALLRQSDYTRKTMEVAETRKALEEKQAEIDRIANLTQEEFSTASELSVLNWRIDQYSNLDTTGWSQEDINAARIDLNEIIRQRDSLQFTLSSKINERQTTRTHELDNLRKSVIEKAAKVVPNFNEQRRAELEAVAVALGVNERDAREIYDANVYKVLHYADIGRKFVESRKKVSAVQADAAVKPAHEVAGKAKSGSDPENMSAEEWIKWRNKQVARR